MESEVQLLLEENETKTASRTCRLFTVELNKVGSIALPMIVVTVSQYLLRISPLFMLGHLDELSLSSASIATSLANVTGYSILFGMASALETLWGQAFGAEQYQKVGTFTYGALVCLFLVSIPVSILWIYAEKLLVFIGQDPLISAEAGKYMIWLIPSLFPYAIYQSLVPLCFHLPICWAFIFKLKLGNSGAALSISISYWLNVILLGLYVILSWWAYEFVILLSGLLPNPRLETSVLSICFSTISLHYHIPDSFGAAASTRISNELGVGKPQAARVAFLAVLVLSVAECITASALIFGARHVMGYAFSYEKEVVDYVDQISPLLSLCVLMDGFEAVLSGMARGSGWQQMAVYVNLGAYYLVGIPMALVAGFVLQLRGEGLWSGLVAGSTLKAVLILIITSFPNWDKQATEARKRIFVDKILCSS
ncbi:putative membrane protein, predicted efflux pump [Handroanthus impetiginosus]|uniref:Putative membrane protein, predicted efflux pump n=1 Tax=Handroanthus impetiginosus TaxID=429701 RepID=A0A2G9H8C7_9LAMI|nr:putative membrane protein, predicted efflux pump [Handroanthus impetiginosus]